MINEDIQPEDRVRAGRDEATLREALQRLINAAWHKSELNERAAFTIPPDHERDADLILGRAITELIQTRQHLGEVLGLLEEFTELPQSDIECDLCETVDGHADDCIFSRGRACLAQYKEQTDGK